MPVTVLQVGEGRFLRAFADVLIAEARRAGRFRGRLVVTSPRPGGGRTLERLRAAGGRYRVVVRGPEGETSEEMAPFDRIVDGFAEPAALLAEVTAPVPLVVLSNTTEAGLDWRPDDPGAPQTYPARLAAWLLARRRAGVAAPTAVLPCELVADNGVVLRAAVARHLEAWGHDAEAVLEGIPFADTLVDRIVTSPDPDDPLLCVTEPYLAWYIAGMPAWVQEALPLDPKAVHWVADVGPARRLKVRLLNGTHTLLAALGLVSGVATVREALAHPAVGPVVRAALEDEAVGSFPAAERPEAERFAAETLRRFANPGIRHDLDRIAVETTAKIRARWVPILEGFRQERGRWPERFALGLAGYLRLATERPGGFDLAPVDDAGWVSRLRDLRQGASGTVWIAEAARDPAWPAPRDPDLVARVAAHLEAWLRDGPEHLARWGAGGV